MDTNTLAKAFSGTFSKMSTPERIFNSEGYFILSDELKSGIEVMLYEWVSFNIPGGRYTPDFFVLFKDGSVVFVEVKQESIGKSGKRYYAGGSYRDSRSKLRAAAELNPWFKFYMAVYNRRDGWRLDPIVPSRGIEYIGGANEQTKKATRNKR